MVSSNFPLTITPLTHFIDCKRSMKSSNNRYVVTRDALYSNQDPIPTHGLTMAGPPMLPLRAKRNNRNRLVLEERGMDETEHYYSDYSHLRNQL